MRPGLMSMPNHTSDTGTDDEYGQRYPQRTRKNSYKKSTGKNISLETRVNERRDDGKKTRHKEYDTNREINNMSTISEKSIIETITQNNITTRLLNIFRWNKQPQNYNEQFRFQYQQLQNQFNNQYQLMHNQYQSLLQQQVHNQQMKTQKTTNQDLTQHHINPHRNINNQDQYTNTNTVQPQTSQTQNTHNRVNLNANRINNNNISNEINKEKQENDKEIRERPKFFKSKFNGPSIKNYKEANLIKEIRKFKEDICIRNAYINDKNELIIITGKEEDQLKIDELKRKNKEYIIVGDFNSDPIRNKKFDRELISLLSKRNLKCIEKEFDNFEYTYSNDQHKSFIDHIVTTIETSNRVLNVTIVRPDPLNQSDHLPLKVKIKVNIDKETENEKKNVQVKKKVEWKNRFIQLEYANKLEQEIQKNRLIEKVYQDPIGKQELDEIINILHRIMINCSKKMENKLNSNKYKRKSKVWWDEKLEKIHTEMKQELWSYKASVLKTREPKRNTSALNKSLETNREKI
ncbi:hypothetical protein BpHYR1_024453 [Brachionus plicatilis]|uniref:RNA-directed DNA polymerase from mobile element jockey-like n=1 Tax=Brachionus plicatilis TaxID=10195 RepID=A0A3M7PZ80_BRAPC|nr:hypothetical protein BpHYR1_024453 [Brachionus plicatilis]